MSILKAPFNIECHFLSILILLYIHTQNTFYYLIIKSYHSLIFYLFFSFLKFSSHYSLKKQKQKFLLLPISPHLWLHFLQPFPSLFASLPPPILSSSLLHFLIIFHNLILLLPILLVHAYGYTSSNLSLPSLPLYLFTSPTTLYFTITLPYHFS